MHTFVSTIFDRNSPCFGGCHGQEWSSNYVQYTTSACQLIDTFDT